jgi:hypothetical protein
MQDDIKGASKKLAATKARWNPETPEERAARIAETSRLEQQWLGTTRRETQQSRKSKRTKLHGILRMPVLVGFTHNC